MRNLLAILATITALATSCQSNGKQTENMDTVPLEDSIPENAKGIKIEGAIGIVTTSDAYEFGDTIPILDQQKKLSQTIVITDEYQKLKLRCLSQTSKSYQVRLDDGNVGYIRKDQPKVKFQTWEEHVLSVFAIGFDAEANPIKKESNNRAPENIYNPDEFYHPSKIQSDWLQIKWGTEGSWKYGWIKWRNEEKLLIELFYFA